MPRIYACRALCIRLPLLSLMNTEDDIRAVLAARASTHSLFSLCRTRASLTPVTTPAPPYAGGWCFAETGTHADVEQFDFRGMYPSIIAAFAVGRSVKCEWCECKGDCMCVFHSDDEQARKDGGRRKHYLGLCCLGQQPHFPCDDWVPRFTSALLRARDAEEHRDTRALLKTAANTLYGALTKFQETQHLPQVITYIGREMLRWTAARLPSTAHCVFADTDSLFVTGMSSEDAENWCRETNAVLPSPMRLVRGPRMRALRVFARKSYACILEDVNMDSTCGVRGLRIRHPTVNARRLPPCVKRALCAILLAELEGRGDTTADAARCILGGKDPLRPHLPLSVNDVVEFSPGTEPLLRSVFGTEPLPAESLETVDWTAYFEEVWRRARQLKIEQRE